MGTFVTSTLPIEKSTLDMFGVKAGKKEALLNRWVKTLNLALLHLELVELEICNTFRGQNENKIIWGQLKEENLSR